MEMCQFWRLPVWLWRCYCFQCKEGTWAGRGEQSTYFILRSWVHCVFSPEKISLNNSFSSLLNTSVRNSPKDKRQAITANDYVWNLRRATDETEGAGLGPAGQSSRYSTSVWIILTCCRKDKSWTLARPLRFRSALSKINRKPILFSVAVRFCYCSMHVKQPLWEASWERKSLSSSVPCLH